jgi:electron transport complex protein RnfE
MVMFLKQFGDAAWKNNIAWTGLLGLCPLLAVSNSVVNALGLAFASTLVLVGSNCIIAVVKKAIPESARLPVFVLIIASLTTCVVLLLQAFAFDLYLKIALFVQIIVTNCMILARAEAHARHAKLSSAFVDALGTGAGFSLALILLGGVRELLATGKIFADLDQLLGPSFASVEIEVASQGALIAALPAGAFIISGLLLALGNAVRPNPE